MLRNTPNATITPSSVQIQNGFQHIFLTAHQQVPITGSSEIASGLK